LTPRTLKKKIKDDQSPEIIQLKKASHHLTMANKKHDLAKLKLTPIYSEKLDGDPIYEDMKEQLMTFTSIMLATERALVKKEITLNENELQMFKTKKVVFNSLK
jgi:hypothetical protein